MIYKIMATIIPRNSTLWQKALKDLVTDPETLFKHLQLDPALLPAAQQAAQRFPVRIPLSFLNRIKPGNIDDPLLRQILPLHAELETSLQFTPDPLGETQFMPVPGLIHKYHGRVLLTLTGACGINCRYCFRREFPYQANNPGALGWDRVVAYIRDHHEITEVIYSGGDPLILPDRTLAQLTQKLAKIPHLKRLRIHSRLPVVIPERLCDEFINWFTSSNLQPILVIHANHPNEINSTVSENLLKLKQHHITLLNQSVILKGVNDHADILVALSEELFQAGVLPYYIHLLDRVSGSAHFEVEEQIAIQLLTEVGNRLPGYLVPKLVRDLPGQTSKKIVMTHPLRHPRVRENDGVGE